VMFGIVIGVAGAIEPFWAAGKSLTWAAVTLVLTLVLRAAARTVIGG
jgi:hypothetical protein